LIAVANTKITELTQLTNPVSTDVLPIVDVGADVTKKISIADLLKNASTGTADAPGIAFDGRSRNGIYSPGVDQVAISTNGTGRLFIDASGNVEIGTSSGGDRTVNIRSTGVTRGVLSTNGSSGEFRIGATNDSAAGTLVFQTGGSLAERARIRADGLFEIKGAGTAGLSPAFSVNASAPSNSLVIDSSGRVGLGTSSPSGALHIASGNLRFTNGSAFSTGNATIASISSFAGSANQFETTKISFETDAFVNRGEIVFSTGDDSNTCTEKARIDYLGRLGLGTGSPVGLLDVRGEIKAGPVNSINGTTLLSDTYTTGGASLGSLCIERSSGAFTLTTNIKQAENATGYISTNTINAGKSALKLGSTGLFYATASASVVPIGNSVSLTDKFAITNEGQVRLAGAGITFNGDTATANELDDYEEGNWSPVYTPSSGSFTTMTMSVSGARYVKIGQQVTVSAYFYSSSVDATGASGSISITGLPFTSRTTQDVRYSGGIGYAVGFTTKPIDWYIENGSTTIVLVESKTNNDFLDVADLATGTGFLNAMYLTATYFVN
jgi:hypothetical protein